MAHAAAKRLTLIRVTPVTEYSSLLKLASLPIDSSVVSPKQYFKASNELVVVNLLVCWTITLVFRPEQGAACRRAT